MKIDLQVRGVCGLKPGVPGVSETITVTSVVGRFLEHVRIYYFRNGGQEELFLGSADFMPRNLDRRVEVLFPIESPQLREAIFQDLLYVNLHDNLKARQLLADGQYTRLKPMLNEKPLNSQEWLLNNWRGRSSFTKS